MKRTQKHKNPASVIIRIAARSQRDPKCSWIAARLKQKRRSNHQKTGQCGNPNCSWITARSELQLDHSPLEAEAEVQASENRPLSLSKLSAAEGLAISETELEGSEDRPELVLDEFRLHKEGDPKFIFTRQEKLPRSFCFRNIYTLRWSHKRSQIDRRNQTDRRNREAQMRA